jgi:hypothetical protein
MKYSLFAIIFVTVLSFAQDKQASYFDSPFGGGGGFCPGWIFSKIDPINDQLTAFGTGKLNTSYFGTGGAGFVYIMVVPGLRIGGMGFGGSTSVTGVDNQGYRKEADYSTSFGGFTIEYTLPFFRDFGISLGTIIGGGSATLELYRNKNTFSWSGLWGQINDETQSTGDFSRTLKNNYFVIAPTLNAEYPFYRFVAVRLGIGYKFAIGNTWNVENSQGVSGVPSNLSSNTFFIQAGIFVGFFSF